MLKYTVKIVKALAILRKENGMDWTSEIDAAVDEVHRLA
jgi:hypothetical protein